MYRIVKRSVLVAIISLSMMVIVAVAWIFKPFDVAQAIGEYLLPTTVEDLVAPQACIETNEPPPPDLMQIVEDQKSLYHLTLQKVSVCRSARRYQAFERRFAGLPFGDEFRKRWKPLSKGCCSCQFRRHVIVFVADSNESGSVVVQAALIQSRWDYLRQNWDENVQKWYRMRSYLSAGKGNRP